MNTKLNIVILIILVAATVAIFMKFTKLSSNVCGKKTTGGQVREDVYVVPDIVGGIGNQLYIVSAAYEYALKNNKTLCIDNSKQSIPSWGKYRPTYNDTLFSK